MATGIPGCQSNASAHLERAEGAGEAPSSAPAGNQSLQEGAPTQGEGHSVDGGLAGVAKKVGGLLFGGREILTSAAHRQKAIELIDEAHAAGADLVSACGEIGICLRTLKLPGVNYVGGRAYLIVAVHSSAGRKPLFVMETAWIDVKAVTAWSRTG